MDDTGDYSSDALSSVEEGGISSDGADSEDSRGSQENTINEFSLNNLLQDLGGFDDNFDGAEVNSALAQASQKAAALSQQRARNFYTQLSSPSSSEDEENANRQKRQKLEINT